MCKDTNYDPEKYAELVSRHDEGRLKNKRPDDSPVADGRKFVREAELSPDDDLPGEYLASNTHKMSVSHQVEHHAGEINGIAMRIASDLTETLDGKVIFTDTLTFETGQRARIIKEIVSGMEKMLDRYIEFKHLAVPTISELDDHKDAGITVVLPPRIRLREHIYYIHSLAEAIEVQLRDMYYDLYHLNDDEIHILVNHAECISGHACEVVRLMSVPDLKKNIDIISDKVVYDPYEKKWVPVDSPEGKELLMNRCLRL